jgi:hypothetical protein
MSIPILLSGSLRCITYDLTPPHSQTYSRWRKYYYRLWWCLRYVIKTSRVAWKRLPSNWHHVSAANLSTVYGDLYLFDAGKSAWTSLNIGGGPSPRAGHSGKKR